MKKKDRALKGLSGHRSSAFMVALKNMTEFAQKTSVIDMVIITNITAVVPRH